MKNSKGLVTALLVGILLSTLIFSPFILDLTLVPRFIVLSFTAIVFLILLWKNYKGNIQIDLPLFFFILYSGFCFVSVFWSTTISETLFESSKTVLSLFVLCATYFSFKNDAGYFDRNFLKVSVIVTLVGSALAVYQYGKVNRADKEFIYAITSMHGHKNLYSSFIFVNLFFLIKGFYFEKGYLKILSGICVLISIILLAFLKTKAVWIGAAATLLIFALLYFFRNLKLKVPYTALFITNLIAANLFFLVVLPWIIHEQVGNYKEKGIGARAERLDSERLVLWEKTYKTFKKIPLIGVGVGNWQIAYANNDINGLYRSDELNYTFQRPHNDLLWILSETGIIGFNLFVISISLILIGLLSVMFNTETGKDNFWKMALCFSFISGFYLASFFDFPKERIEHLIWISVLLGIAYYFIKKDAKEGSISEIKSKPLSVFLVLFFSFIASIGYLRYKGEYFVKKLYEAKTLQNDELAIKDGHRAFSFAYAIDPTSVPIHWFTGNSYAKLGDNVSAQKDFLIAYKYNPYNRNVLNDLASSYAVAGDFNRAKLFYKESARISPRFDDPKLNLAAIYIQEQNFLAADSSLRSMVHGSEKRTQYQNMVNAFLGRADKKH